MDENKITYKKFIEDFQNTKADKVEEFIRSHITKTYVDYQNKLADVKSIVSIGNYTTITIPTDDEIKEKRVFKRNTPIMFYFLKLKLIANYTDIDIPNGDEELEAFNELEKLGLIDNLISYIPENEITKYYTMIDMMNDDIYMNERDLASYLDTKVDAIELVFNTLSSVFGDIINKIGLEQVEDEN